jgi:hypothetical protein
VHSELERRRNVPVLGEALVSNASIRLGSFGDRRRCGTWLEQRYFSADAQSESESQRKGLQESQIGQELLSEAKDQSSAGSSQGLQLSVPYMEFGPGRYLSCHWYHVSIMCSSCHSIRLCHVGNMIYTSVHLPKFYSHGLVKIHLLMEVLVQG